MTRKANLPLVLGVCALVCFAVKDRLERVTQRPLQYRPTLLPLQARYQGTSLRRFSFGMENLLADLLWIQLLQRASHDPVTDDRVSWEYAQLDAITRLDRRFQRAFQFGASFLSVLRRDRLGAKALLERWVELEPWTWRSHYTLGYHLYFELNDMRRAAPYILRAASMEGAPLWLAALGVRLVSDSGALLQALQISLDLYRDLPSPITRDRLAGRIRSVRYALQRTAWEEALTKYREANRNEPTSLAALAPYLAPSDPRALASLQEGDPPEKLVALVAETFPFRYDPKSRKIAPLHPGAVKDIEQLGIYRQ